MIVIKSIETFETDLDPVEVWGTTAPSLRPHDPVFFGEELVAQEVFRELIHGVRLTRPDGTKVIVGASEQAKEVLGLLYNDWYAKENAIQQYWQDLCGVRQQLGQALKTCRLAEEATLWQRICWVFTGCKLKS